MRPNWNEAAARPARSAAPPAPAGLKSWLRRELGVRPLLEPLPGGGGARRYFRAPGLGLLALHGPDHSENMAWLRIGRHLWSKGLPLPIIRRQDIERGFFLLDDLGDDLLDRVPDRLEHLPQAAANLARLHRTGLSGYDPAWAQQTRVFSRSLVIRLEVNYFIEFFIKKYLELKISSRRMVNEAREFGRLALPSPADNVLMHRDYQGRNLIVRDGEVFMLDWQGARLGPAAYDLASLLEDCPHDDLSPEFRDMLINIYLKKSGRRGRLREFRRELAWLGASRLMQALGAFGRLTIAGRPGFVRSMAPVLRRLKARFDQPDFKRFPALRETLAAAWAALPARAPEAV